MDDILLSDGSLFGDARLDETYRRLVQDFQKADQLILSGRSLEIVRLDFCRRAVDAFRSEETRLQELGNDCERLAQHKDQHRKLFADLQACTEGQQFVTFLEDWLRRHGDESRLEIAP